jgi:hypothetical protein
MVLGFLWNRLAPPSTPPLIPDLLHPANAGGSGTGGNQGGLEKAGQFIRRCWRMDQAGRISDLTLRVR